MTDNRVAALSSAGLVNPDPAARVAATSALSLSAPDPAHRVAAGSVMVLQRVANIEPARLRTAAASAQLLDSSTIVTTQLAGISAQALVPVEPELPDSGQRFQWWSPGTTHASGWVVDVERSRALTSYTASSGRADAVSKVPPVTITLVLAMRHTPAPELGETFRVAIATALRTGRSIDRVRFTGEVTDVLTDPLRGTHTVTGVGKLARVGRRMLDVRGLGTQPDGARVAQLLDAARAEAGVIDAGAPDLLADPDAERVTLVSQLDLVTDSTTGVVLEQRTGLVDYHDAEHRRGAPVVVELDASEVLNDFTWAKRSGDLINLADVTWGTDDAVVRVTDPESIEAREEYPETRSTQLAAAVDAYSLGSLIVGRRSTPTWQLPTVTVDLLRTITDPAKRGRLLSLATGSRIRLTGLPPGGDYTSAELFVEGATESTAVTPGQVLPVEERTTWLLTLTVSDPALSGVTLRWLDVPEDTTWDNVDPDLTWLDLSRVENPDVLTPQTP